MLLENEEPSGVAIEDTSIEYLFKERGTGYNGFGFLSIKANGNCGTTLGQEHQMKTTEISIPNEPEKEITINGTKYYRGTPQ